MPKRKIARTHASFYEVDPEIIERILDEPVTGGNAELTKIKEASVFEDFLPYFQKSTGERIDTYGEPDQDPPDRELVSKSGKTFFFEITELVSQTAIRNQISRDKLYRLLCEGKERYLNQEMDAKEAKKYLKQFDQWKASSRDHILAVNSWDKSTFFARLCSRINEKTQKCASIKNECDNLELLLHTDEPSLSSELIEDYLNDFSWPCNSSFDAGYILVAYEPGNEDTRVIPLPPKQKRKCAAYKEYVLSGVFLSGSATLPRHSCKTCKNGLLISDK